MWASFSLEMSEAAHQCATSNGSSQFNYVAVSTILRFCVAEYNKIRINEIKINLLSKTYYMIYKIYKCSADWWRNLHDEATQERRNVWFERSDLSLVQKRDSAYTTRRLFFISKPPWTAETVLCCTLLSL